MNEDIRLSAFNQLRKAQRHLNKMAQSLERKQARVDKEILRKFEEFTGDELELEAFLHNNL